MASSATAHALSHAMPPPFVLPAPPRIRPPRMMPGQHHPNQDHKPPDVQPPELGKVWAQGKWRDKSSKAAQHERHLLGRRVERAVEAKTHGTTIYAYSHVRTNQVVYSLSKIMRNGRIMGQLRQVYHGKKTIPAALRRDMWRPYWRVDFPSSRGGKEMGRLAFSRLRELSLQRQLDPPDDLVLTTEEDVEKVRKRYSPAQIEQLVRRRKVKLPIVGQLLPKELRARRLMDQKATSVADLALCLGLQEEQGWDIESQLQEREDKRREKMAERTRLYRRRMRFIEEEWRQIDTEQGLHAASIHGSHQEDGNVGLDSYTRRRIAMAHDGLLTQVGDIVDLRFGDSLLTINDQLLAVRSALDDLEAGAESQPKQEDASRTQKSGSPKVNVVWADRRDQNYAQAWPRNVLHGQLEQKAVVRSADAPDRQVESSVHVMGSAEGSGQYTPSSQLKENRAAERERKMEKYQQLQKNAREEDALAFQQRLLDLELQLQAELVNIKVDTAGDQIRRSEFVLSLQREYEMQRLTLLEELNRFDHDRPGTTSPEEPKRFPEYADVRLYLEETLQERLGKLDDQLAEDVIRPIHVLRQQISQACSKDAARTQAEPEAESNVTSNEVPNVPSEKQDRTSPAMHARLQEFLDSHPKLKQPAEQILIYARHNLDRQNEWERIRSVWDESSNVDAGEVREKIMQLRERSISANSEILELEAELSATSKDIETQLNQKVDEIRTQKKEFYAAKGKTLTRSNINKFSTEVTAMPEGSTLDLQEKLVALVELRARETSMVKKINEQHETTKMAEVRKEIEQLRFQQRELLDKIQKTKVETTGHEDPAEIRGFERQREQIVAQIQQQAVQLKKLVEAKENQSPWRGEIKMCQTKIRGVEREIERLQRQYLEQSEQRQALKAKIAALRPQIIEIKPEHEQILVEEARQRGKADMDDAVEDLRAAMRQDSLAVIEQYRRLLGSKRYIDLRLQEISPGYEAARRKRLETERKALSGSDDVVTVSDDGWLTKLRKRVFG